MFDDLFDFYMDVCWNSVSGIFLSLYFEVYLLKGFIFSYFFYIVFLLYYFVVNGVVFGNMSNYIMYCDFVVFLVVGILGFVLVMWMVVLRFCFWIFIIILVVVCVVFGGVFMIVKSEV